MNDQAAEDNLGLRNEVMDNLAQHQRGIQTSLEQVYNQVEDLHKSKETRSNRNKKCTLARSTNRDRCIGDVGLLNLPYSFVSIGHR